MQHSAKTDYLAVGITVPASAPQVPYNTTAEQAVLGAILLDRDAIILVAPLLEVEDFYHPQHQQVYAAMLELYGKRQPADYITTAEVLRQREQLEAIGGEPYLLQMIEVPPHSYHVEYHAKIVRDAAAGRRMIAVGSDIAAMGYSNKARDELLAEAQRLLDRTSRQSLTSDLKFPEQISRRYQAALENDEPLGLATGLHTLDEHLVGGLHIGELILLAARPSLGKSALALQITYNVAKRGNFVLFVSLEMKERALWQRLIAIESGMDLTLIRQHRRQSQEEFGRHVEADGALSALPFAIADDFGTSLLDIRSKTLALQAERGKLSLLVIDYLGLINHKASKRGDSNRVQDVSEISRGLKQLAGELNCPVLALAQLNREVEHRTDGIPKLADLRDSGSLEQDADVVMFLDCEELRKPDTQLKGVTDIYIAKHRQGALGKLPMLYNRATGRWSDLTYRVPDGY